MYYQMVIYPIYIDYCKYKGNLIFYISVGA